MWLRLCAIAIGVLILSSAVVKDSRGKVVWRIDSKGSNMVITNSLGETDYVLKDDGSKIRVYNGHSRLLYVIEK